MDGNLLVLHHLIKTPGSVLSRQITDQYEIALVTNAKREKLLTN